MLNLYDKKYIYTFFSQKENGERGNEDQTCESQLDPAPRYTL